MEKSESIKELATALVKAQSEIKNAPKDSDNPFFKSKYADLATVMDVVKPVFTKHGLAFIQMPGHEGEMITLTTMIVHESGEFISEVAKVRPVKTDPQAAGSAITYLRRYALAAFAGVAQEDDDANTHIAGRKGGQNPYKVAEAVQQGKDVASHAAIILKYDIGQIAEDRKEAAEAYLMENDAVFDDDSGVWESKKALPKLKDYLLKR